MEGLKQFIVSIVEQTIQSLHDRGLLLVNEGDEEKAARMFNGKLELSINDLRSIQPADGHARRLSNFYGTST